MMAVVECTAVQSIPGAAARWSAAASSGRLAAECDASGLLASGWHKRPIVDAETKGLEGQRPVEPVSVLGHDGGDHEVCWTGCASEGNGVVLSLVRSIEEIFGVTPLLRDATNQPDLGDLFTSFP